MLKDILKLCKVNHYIKNVIIIIPLIFSKNLLTFNLYPKCLLMFLGFCFISSAVYIMNDIVDIEKDKVHPAKCKRPIASGKINKNFGIFLCLFLIFLSIACSIFINWLCVLMICLYFILNIFYSLYLKNISLIDVACIATGFILRIVGGCFCINVLPSPLVILMTFFVSMFFTFSKRKLELELIKEPQQCRKSIEKIDINSINQFILLNAVLSISFYITYVLDNSTMQRAGTEYLYLTAIPFTLIIFRLLLLVNTININDDPIYFLENDNTLKYLIILYFVVIFIVLYF
ncbi:UbiA prenyltransferase family protein [bacterium]|nr:UbiA prenyltransferase family protein [bacterium]